MVKSPITDSPWLWFSLFTAAGLLALVATGGKFGARQANIERQAQARTAIAEGLAVAENGVGRKATTGVPKYSDPDDTQVRLLPLTVILGMLCAGSFGMLVRERLFLHPN